MAQAVYSGSLQPKKKAELQQIALGLQIRAAGTREELQQRIRKHLDENQASLEDNPAFSGLFLRKKRTVQIQLSSASTPSDAADDTLVRKPMTPPSTRLTRRSVAIEATPAADVREVSMMLNNPPISPPEEESPPESVASVEPVAQTPHKDGALITSTPRSILRNLPKPSLELADTTIKTIQTGTQHRVRVYLLASRSTLSNSVNIWLITALLELLYVLYEVIPWKAVEIPSSRGAGSFSLTFSYPPLMIFQSPAFWSVLLHWSIPALIIPAVFASIISFHPANAASARVPRILPFDPLTASITRLAAQWVYPYHILNVRAQGIDVIGPQWRILSAALGVAFAFAEAIFVAPSAYSDSRKSLRAPTPRRSVGPEE